MFREKIITFEQIGSNKNIELAPSTAKDHVDVRDSNRLRLTKPRDIAFNSRARRDLGVVHLCRSDA